MPLETDPDRVGAVPVVGFLYPSKGTTLPARPSVCVKCTRGRVFASVGILPTVLGGALRSSPGPLASACQQLEWQLVHAARPGILLLTSCSVQIRVE